MCNANTQALEVVVEMQTAPRKNPFRVKALINKRVLQRYGDGAATVSTSFLNGTATENYRSRPV